MFNIEDFDIKLTTDFVGRNFIYTEEVNSTNSFLLDSEEFTNDGSVFLAEYQTNGKGRKSRVWFSNAGQNLLFSILINRELNEKKINYLNLGASLAVAQSLESLFQFDTSLKWPNDVLVNNKKIAGILIENVIVGNNIEKVVIGIGLNVNQPIFQGTIDFPVQPTSVRIEFKKEVSRERLLSEILNNFEEVIKLVEENPKKVITQWKERCKMIGENIKLSDDTKQIYGKFVDVDENGYMLLKIGDKLETIHFGEVSLR